MSTTTGRPTGSMAAFVIVISVLGIGAIGACTPQSAAPSTSAAPGIQTAGPSVSAWASAVAQTPVASDSSPAPSPSPITTATPAPPAPTAPSSAEWIGPERISTEQDDFVRLVVDADGYVHVAAVDRDGIFYLTDATGSWTRERLTTVVGDAYDGEPSIVSFGDSIAIAFTRFEGLRCTLSCEPVRSQGIYLLSNRSGGWAEPIRVVAGRSQQPSLDEMGGRLHLAYSSGDRNDRSIHYASEAEGLWPRVQVGAGNSPSLRLGGDGLARVTYVDTQGSLYLATGVAGSFDVELVPATQRATIPLLALDAGDQPQIVFFHDSGQGDPNCGARHVRRADGTWSNTTSVFPNDDLCQVMAEGIDATSDGSLHVISLYDASGQGVWYAAGPTGDFRAWQIREPEAFTDDGPRGVSALTVDAQGRPHILYGVLEANAYDEGEQGQATEDGLWYVIGPGQ